MVRDRFFAPTKKAFCIFLSFALVLGFYPPVAWASDALSGGEDNSGSALPQETLAITYQPGVSEVYPGAAGSNPGAAGVDSAAGANPSAAGAAAATASAGVDSAAGAAAGSVEVSPDSQTYGESSYTLFEEQPSKAEVAAGVIAAGVDQYLDQIPFDLALGLTVADVSQGYTLVMNDPNYFFVGNGARISYYADAEEQSACSAAALVVSYAWEKNELDSRRAALESAVQEALTWVSADMTPLQKTQALHDYLVRTCTYDERCLQNPPAEPWASHTAYGALVDKTPVCQGYGAAYKLLLTRLEIPCVYVSSAPMVHGWNMVELDGAWYHVDVTWDDPLYITGGDGGFDGEVSHEYFLKSDATFLELEHHDWTSAYTAGEDYPAYDYPVYNGPCGREDVIVASGTGADVASDGGINASYRWQISQAGTLTIIGKGPLDGTFYNLCNTYSVKKVIISEGITTVGAEAFWYAGTLESVSLPSTVTSIKASAFEECASLAKVTIADKSQLQAIGDRAFVVCRNLESFDIPNTVTSIGNAAFYECSAATFNIFGENSLSQLQEIGPYAFEFCHFGDVYLPSTVVTLGMNSFYGAQISSFSWKEDSQLEVIGKQALMFDNGVALPKLPKGLKVLGEAALYGMTNTEVTIPASLTTIDTMALYGCTALENIAVAPENPVFKSVDGVLYSQDGTLLQYPQGRTNASYTIPAGTVRVGDYAFTDSVYLRGVAIPEGVISLGAFALQAQISEIALPSSLESLGRGALGNQAASVTVAPGSQHFVVEDNVLYSKDKTGLYWYAPGKEGADFSVPSSVEKIAGGAFSRCQNLKKLQLPNSLKEIEASAFVGLEGIALNIPGSVTSIPTYLFYETSASEVTVFNPQVYELLTGEDSGQYHFDCTIKAGSCLEKGHAFSVVENPEGVTCTAAGTVQQVCSVCGYSQVVDAQGVVLDASGHAFERIGIEGYCDDPSRDRYTCTRCGYSYDVVYTRGWGHCFGEDLGKCGRCQAEVQWVSLVDGLCGVLLYKPANPVQTGSVLYRGMPMTWSEKLGCWALMSAATLDVARLNDGFSVSEDVQPSKQLLKGDVNNNGRFNIVDAQLVYEMACSKYMPWDLSIEQWLEADVNGNNGIEAADAFALQRALHCGWE